MKFSFNLLKPTSVALLVAGMLSACAAPPSISTQKHDNNVSNGRFYGVSSNESLVLEGPAFEKRDPYAPIVTGGSFYATVKNGNIQRHNVIDNGTGMERTLQLYQLQLVGERGTEVNILTEKPAQIGERVLFVYSKDKGQIFRSHEPEYQHHVPLKRNPK